MYIDIVKSVWIIDQTKCQRIFPNMSPYSFVVLESVKGFWCGIRYSVLNSTNIDEFAHLVGNEFDEFSDINEGLVGMHAAFRNHLRDRKLGPPTFSVKSKKPNTSDGGCACEMLTLMIKGCPSTRGLTCPSKV